MKDVTKLLENDSSFQVVPPHTDSFHGLAFLDGTRKMFGRKYAPQTKERAAYESGAKIYYELGFRDGQDECSTVHKANNVDKDDYDFMMKLLSLMGMSYMYVNDFPLIQKEAYRKVTGQEPKMPFHPGLNLVQNEKCHLTNSELTPLREIVNSLWNKKRSNH